LKGWNARESGARGTKSATEMGALERAQNRGAADRLARKDVNITAGRKSKKGGSGRHPLEIAQDRGKRLTNKRFGRGRRGQGKGEILLYGARGGEEGAVSWLAQQKKCHWRRKRYGGTILPDEREAHT